MSSAEEASDATTAVDRQIAAAIQSSRGIVALDSTNLESSDSSGYPPATMPGTHAKTKRRHRRIPSDPLVDAGGGDGLYGGGMSNTLVHISLLETAAVETPAALDTNTAERPQHGHGGGRQHQQSRLVPQQQQQQQRRRHRPPSHLANDSSSSSSSSSSMGFMTSSGPSGSASQNFSRRRVAIGRKRHQLISNVASFEAFSTSEAEEDIRSAVAGLMNEVEADQTAKGGPTHRGELWKLIESFFDAIPFVGVERGEIGQRQFTQYLRVMSALREGIRACIYDNYDPAADHRTLIPNFSALELARQNIVTLEAAVLDPGTRAGSCAMRP